MLHLNIRAHLNRSGILSKTLINMGLLDELISGFLFIGLPLVRDQLGLSYEQLGLLFTVGACSGMILDPILSLLSDRSSKRWWILAGFLGLAVGFALLGSVQNFALLLATFVLIFPADSAAVGLSEAALIDIAPNDSVRSMTRWTLLSSIGDLLSPLAITAVLAIGLGWSGLCWVAAGLWLVCARRCMTRYYCVGQRFQSCLPCLMKSSLRSQSSTCAMYFTQVSWSLVSPSVSR